MDRRGTLGIIGGGVIGLAVANEMAGDFENVFVFEKCKYVGDGQSGRNSGIVHSGIYYRPGSLKAELCVAGSEMLYQFCADNEIPCRRTGKLIVSVREGEEEVLKGLFRKGTENGIRGLELVGAEKVRELEPNVRATAGLYIPSSGIVDAASLTQTLARLAKNQGVHIMPDYEVLEIHPERNGFRINGEERVDFLVNAAGLYADEIAKKLNPGFPHTIIPLRGEYFSFRQRRPELRVERSVYPVPKPYYLGVHLTPTFDGNKVLVGPTGVEVGSKEDYEQGRWGPEKFLEAVLPYFPNLRLEDLTMEFAGIRAKKSAEGDFVIERDSVHPRCIHILAPSPGLTSSLAIAKKVGNIIASMD